VGTVVGSGRVLGGVGAGAGATSGAMGNVMSAIAEALVATAVGILVALPAVIAYNTFQKKAVQIEDNVGTLGNLVVAHMKAVGKSAHGRLRSVQPEGEAERWPARWIRPGGGRPARSPVSTSRRSSTWCSCS